MKLRNTLVGGMAAGLWFLSNSAGAAIVGSLHDLSGGTANTDQVCIFCHTPHGADTTAPVPLWNKVLDNAGFTEYTSSTLDGTTDITTSVSLACLSCHDGSQAMDTVLNQPGTGGYDAAGAEIDAGNIGVIAGAGPFPNLTKDLSDDHPVSVQYAGGGLTWNTIQAGNNVADSANDKSFVDPVYNAGTDKMAVGSLPLYEGSGAATGPLVECASCHDPHSSNATFLRISNAASAVCVSCHVK